MTDSKQAVKPEKKTKSIEDEIAALTDKLRKATEKKKEQDRKAREKNQKAVLELIKAEKLDMVPTENWQQAMPKIRALLTSESAPIASQPEVVQVALSAATSPAPVEASAPALSTNP